ncbi:MAG: hypothetical protein NTW70_03585 [Chloroflexi bacterium]|nr:hypothetical protein [Chloroflexota bacterium]
MSETLVPIASALPLIATSLTPGLPKAAELFDFAGGAERRFRTLRLRIEERTVTAAGEGLGSVELLIDRPLARVTTVHPQGGYDVWVTDGANVRSYNAVTKTTTRRPHRAAPTGLDDSGLPQSSRVPTNMGPLPGKGWATSFVRPGSFCSSVLAGAVLGAVHETRLVGRVALTIEAAAPRAVALEGDRADFRFRVTFDRLTGLLLGVEEFRGTHLVRSALCTAFEADASIPTSAFDLELPPDVVTLY